MSSDISTTAPSGTRPGLRRDSAAPPAEPRLDAFDALRATAMLLVVTAHVAVVYNVVRIPNLLWTLRDPSRALAFDALFWVCISVSMPAFFVLSGFFAVRSCDRRGPSGFARDRVRRIVLPFLVGGAVVLPASLVVWALGWLSVGRCTWRQIYRFHFIDKVIRYNYFGPAHLWFLEYLIFMLAAYALYRRATRGVRPRSAGSARWLLHPLAPLALAVPTALILWTGHRRFGIDPVSDLRNSFLPDPFRWAHHAWFFAVGTWLYRARPDLGRLSGRAWMTLALASAAYVVRFRLLEANLETPATGLDAVWLAVSGALFGWLGLFAVMGLFLRLGGRARGPFRYLSESSYWVYLTHLPVTGLAQVAFAKVPIGCGWKFAAGMAITLGIGLASYEVLVRKTRIGLWLNGGRARVEGPRRRESTAAPTCPAPSVGLR